jgi:hypothetical protein
VVGARRGRRTSKTSQLADVLDALGEVWAEHPSLHPEPLVTRARNIRLERNRPAQPTTVVPLASRRSREVARAS